MSLAVGSTGLILQTLSHVQPPSKQVDVLTEVPLCGAGLIRLIVDVRQRRRTVDLVRPAAVHQHAAGRRAARRDRSGSWALFIVENAVKTKSGFTKKAKCREGALAVLTPSLGVYGYGWKLKWHTGRLGKTVQFVEVLDREEGRLRFEQKEAPCADEDADDVLDTPPTVTDDDDDLELFD